SLDGEIHDFKPGAFRLAQDENVEVLPVVIDGTGDALPKHSWYLEKTTEFRLVVGKPVEMSTGGADSVAKTISVVRQTMIEMLKELRAEK
ncbi:MAG: 1-acyl-sn-glycerol-3-phosphate acyltransferase, partial [Candidatus Omnitrophica bacterium]|nr:1-acyl-sn-glycerol-3-phosphate acyltransferase [Candidatus Omnitrophota bacterium]